MSPISFSAITIAPSPLRDRRHTTDLVKLWRFVYFSHLCGGPIYTNHWVPFRSDTPGSSDRDTNSCLHVCQLTFFQIHYWVKHYFVAKHSVNKVGQLEQTLWLQRHDFLLRNSTPLYGVPAVGVRQNWHGLGVLSVFRFGWQWVQIGPQRGVQYSIMYWCLTVQRILWETDNISRVTGQTIGYS